jgi:hypothetical protein
VAIPWQNRDSIHWTVAIPWQNHDPCFKINKYLYTKDVVVVTEGRDKTCVCWCRGQSVAKSWLSFHTYTSCSLSPEITPFRNWTVAKSWQDRDRTVAKPWLCYIKNALFHRGIFLIGIPIIFHLKNVVFTLKTWFSEVFSCLFSKKSKLWDEDSQMSTWLPRFWGLHDFIGFLGIVLSIWNFFRVLYI